MQLSLTVIVAGLLIVAFFATSRNQEAQSKLIFNAYQVVHRREWWRTFSHALLHADGIHLFVNAFVFYSFGSGLEALWSNPELMALNLRDLPRYSPMQGRLMVLLLFLGGVFFGSLPALRKHKDNPGYNAVGASGGVSAVLIASAVVMPLASLDLLILPFFDIPAWLMAILFFVYESYMNKVRRSNVAHDAHLAGAAFGILFVALLSYKYLIRFVELVWYNISDWLGLVN